LQGRDLPRVFETLAARNVKTLRYDTFFGAFARVIGEEPTRAKAACDVFAAHEPNGMCPVYVKNELPKAL
jgi:hypothetical protein